VICNTTDTLLERLYLIPDELVELDHWLVWRQEDRGGKPTKVPYTAHALTRRAESNNPATWATFGQAVKVFADELDTGRRFDGIGYVFADDDPYTGVDFDRCVTGDTILPEVVTAIQRLGGYAEISPSLTGVKLWTRAPIDVPEGRTGFKRKGLFGCKEVEVYKHGRYFTVTGREVTL